MAEELRHKVLPFEDVVEMLELLECEAVGSYRDAVRARHERERAGDLEEMKWHLGRAEVWRKVLVQLGWASSELNTLYAEGEDAAQEVVP